MLILSFLQQFLKADLKIFYKSRREEARRHYNIPLTDKLWFNGFDHKSIIFINNMRRLEYFSIPIQRMVWINNAKERTHIYLRPSFAIKRCPFPAPTLEYVWEQCIRCETDPFETIEDPNNLLDSSIPLEFYTNKIFSLIGSSRYMGEWNRLYSKIFYSLPIKVERMLVEPHVPFPERTLRLIKFFVKDVRFNIPKYEHLSFANFQIPLK